MKTASIIRNAILICGLAASANCFGDTIYLASGAAETLNKSNSATVNISKNPLWSNPFTGTSWVSNVQSGDPSTPGFVAVPNGTNVIFTDTFTVNGTPNLGTLIVMADDTASVSLNGTLLEASAPTAGNTYTTCSDYTIGCNAKTTGSIDLTPYLHSGANTLSFDVQQIANGSYGLDYSGVVVSSSATPEPGTLALFGLPLIALSLLRRKRSA